MSHSQVKIHASDFRKYVNDCEIFFSKKIHWNDTYAAFAETVLRDFLLWKTDHDKWMTIDQNSNFNERKGK